MARYRVTFFLNQFTMGWSETYITRDVAATGLADLTQRLINRRNDLLFFSSHNWVGVRFALVGSTRQSQVYLPGTSKFFGGGEITIPAKGNRTEVGPIAEKPDQLRAVLQYLVTFGNTRKAIRYMSGIPDGVSQTEPGTFTFSNNTDWGNKLLAFLAQLSSDSWAIQAIVAPTDLNNVPVRGLISHDPAPSVIGLVITSATAPALGDPPLVHLRNFRRKGRGGISLNGKFYVQEVAAGPTTGTTTWFLRGTETANPADFKVLGKVQPVQTDFFTIQDARAYRVGIHKRGRPSMAPRGRRLSRLTLDP